MNPNLCLITGVGPDTGTALTRRFAEGGYQIAMLARNEKRLAHLEKEVSGAYAYSVDVSDPRALRCTIEKIVKEHGSPAVVIHNAVGQSFGDFQEIDPAMLEHNFQVNTMALLYLAKALSPSMIAAGHGAILCTGNTASYRGKPRFAAFAPSKAAQRILAESLARSLGPHGIHVCYVAIDGVIDQDRNRKIYANQDDNFFCQPYDIANECFHLVHQPRSCWSFDVIVRPYGESW